MLADLDPAVRARVEQECRAAAISAPAFWLTARLPGLPQAGGLREDMPQDLVDTLNRWHVVRFGDPTQTVEDLDRDPSGNRRK